MSAYFWRYVHINVVNINTHKYLFLHILRTHVNLSFFPVSLSLSLYTCGLSELVEGYLYRHAILKEKKADAGCCV